ncbi:MAG: hypothetical protein IMW89_19070, partial [Ktedonobacteraceae bacterium]|nr:hypothetical protein [Ktedonobacteraceae bacterium]
MRYWKRVLRKLPGGDAYSLAAVALIGLATVLRLALIAQGWPPLDSDEGTMGLMGMHIAFRGEFPIFFYGQGYMGTLEAYLAAVFFRLFGISTFTLLLGLVILYALFLSVMYRLTSLLYSKGLALLTLGLLCFGSNPMLTRELVAIGGYPETLLFGALLLLLASWLALTSSREPDAFTLSERRKRLATYGLWGFVAGLGLWTHMLVLPFVLLGGLLISLFCRNEWRSSALFFLLIFLIIGMLPMIIYNVMASPGQDTLSYLLRVHSASGIPGVSARPPFWEQLRGALLISMPTATGATPLCAPSQVDFTRLSDAATMRCTLW